MRNLRSHVSRSEKTKFKDEEKNLSQSKQKWTENEQKKLLYCLKLYGHKDIENAHKELPDKSKDEIRRFLILAHAQARKKNTMIPDIKYWFDRTESEMKRKSSVIRTTDLFQVAQVMKFLSVDGLVENHPPPEKCEDIDFVAAYRLLYQALMGYPLQPVNEATANFIDETLTSLNINSSLINDLTKFLAEKFGSTEVKKRTESKNVNAESMEIDSTASPSETERKSVIVYQKKKPSVIVAPFKVKPLKIVIEEQVSQSTSDGMKSFSMKIQGSKDISTLCVPITTPKPKSAIEEAASTLWKKVGFNPLELPDKYFQRPMDCRY